MSKLIIDIDNHNELGGADLVVYDVSEVVLNENYKISSIEDLRSHLNKNGLDEESFEINRVTLIRSKDF